MPATKSHEQVLSDHSIPGENGCIVWVGSKDKDGYGKCRRRHELGTIWLPHRLAWIVKHGAIPKGLEVDHLCRNRSCINPEHLTVVDHISNVERSIYKRENHRNFRKTHCKRGHPLNGDNLIVETWHGIVMRKCLTCRKENARRNYKIRVSEV